MQPTIIQFFNSKITLQDYLYTFIALIVCCIASAIIRRLDKHDKIGISFFQLTFAIFGAIFLLVLLVGMIQALICVIFYGYR